MEEPKQNEPRRFELERRVTVPQAIENPEDCVVGEAEGDLFDERQRQRQRQRKTTKAAQEPEPSTTLAMSEIVPKEARNLIAGGIAGMVAKSIVAPLDRIKILYQVSSAKFRMTDVPKVAKKIVETEGLSALWKGNTATMVRIFPYSGIQFMVFDRIKSVILVRDQQHILDKNVSHRDRKFGLTPMESLLAGMMAGSLSVMCTYPLDLTRAQLAVIKRHRHQRNRGFTALLKENYTSRGIPGLFRGITPTILGIIPYAGFAFALNEQGKREIQHLAKREVTTVERMQCGAVAGLVAQTITYPIEVCRRRMQTIGLVGTDTAIGNLKVAAATSASAIATSSSEVAAPPSLRTIVRNLYVEQGIPGFFKGVSMNWMKGPVAFSISFTAFDHMKELMESESEKALRIPRRWSTAKLDKKQ